MGGGFFRLRRRIRKRPRGGRRRLGARGPSAPGPAKPNAEGRGLWPRPPAFVRAMRARRPPGDASLCHGPLQIIVEGPMDQGIARLGRVDAVRGDQIPIVVLIQKIGAHVHHREPAA